MALQEFKFPVLANDTGETRFVVRKAQFGDSYMQVSGEGLQSSVDSWAVSYAGLWEDVVEVENFLKDHKGYMSFAWRTPKRELKLFRAETWQVLPYAKDVFRLTTTFEEAFAP